MAVDKKGDLYVLSFNNHGVWRYNGGMSWTNVDPVNDVQSMVVDGKGDLYVLSFNSHGVFQYAGGTSWTTSTRQYDVESMAVNKNGDLFVLSFNGPRRVAAQFRLELDVCRSGQRRAEYGCRW